MVHVKSVIVCLIEVSFKGKWVIIFLKLSEANIKNLTQIIRNLVDQITPTH